MMAEALKDMAIKHKHVKAVIQLRRATEKEWIEVNPILRVGEPALSTDVYKLKIGNGQNHWSELKYLNAGGVTSINGQIGDVTITEGLEPLIGTTNTVTPQQVMAALGEGRDIYITVSASLDDVPLELKFTSFNRATDTVYNGMAFNVVVSQTIASYNGVLYLFELVGGTLSMEPYPWEVIQTNLATFSDLDGAVSDLWNNFVNYVPTEREVNGKALSADITLSAADVGAIPTSAKGAANGVAPLDANSKIDSQYLPSYVDDVIEAYSVSGATALSAGWLSATSGGSALTPETGKIYVLMVDSGDYSANTQFRWGGSTYVKLADGGVSSITNLEIDAIVAS